MMRFLALFAILAGLMLLLGCTSAPSEPSKPSDVATIKLNGTGVDSMKNDAAAVKNQTPAAKNPVVVFETNRGAFKAEIFLKEAPITSSNFLGLVSSGFYNNLTFHRVVPNFVVQGGDPLGTGMGGSGKTIPLEVKVNLKHNIGTLAMARSSDPNSASSQFYVVTGPASFLDGQYAVFGQVQGSGMDVVNKLVVGDRMTKVYLES